jgi:hypothetical protein
MFKEIPKSDIVVRPFKVYKEWRLDEEDINPIFAKSGSFGDYDSEIDEKSHGFSKISLFRSIKAQFYTNAATASILTEVGRKKWGYGDGRDRVLEENMAVISIPQNMYGEGLKPGSVVVDDNGDLYVDDGYSNLIDSGSNIYGNIFYDRGLIVITKNVVTGSTLSNFTIDFRSTKTIFENEIFISVLENEFNYSMNPSSYYEDGAEVTYTVVNKSTDKSLTETYLKKIVKPGVKFARNSRFPYYSHISGSTSGSLNQKFGSFDDYEFSSSIDPTGSYLAPYITTIGLYDNELNMVAVAKLPQPIKSLPDYPVNFIIRFDT